MAFDHGIHGHTGLKHHQFRENRQPLGRIDQAIPRGQYCITQTINFTRRVGMFMIILYQLKQCK